MAAEPQSISFQSFGHKAVERPVLHYLLCYLFPILYHRARTGLGEGGEGEGAMEMDA